MQMVQELWTAHGRDQELYAAIRPRMSLSKFSGHVTDLVVRGLEEGWIELRMPVAPVNDDAAYEIVFRDADRFIDELGLMFPPQER
jgi:gamma-glutamylcysteine synthetase